VNEGRTSRERCEGISSSHDQDSRTFQKKDSKWRPWKESIITYLNAQTGQANLPLAYIIREREVADLQAIFTTTHDELVDCAILYGTEFNANNGRVYDFLQSLSLNGPAWPWIMHFSVLVTVGALGRHS
jgi:hypothetical protein